MSSTKCSLHGTELKFDVEMNMGLLWNLPKKAIYVKNKLNTL